MHCGTEQSSFCTDHANSECALPHHGAVLGGQRVSLLQVDIDAPDLEQFPKFADLKHWDCILEPGDMLFIPNKWWHYVKSLTVSFSVSFWWQ